VKATDVMLCWNPNSADVALVPWPDREGRSDRYLMTTLACNLDLHRRGFERRKLIVFIEAMHLIVRDGVDPVALHRTLLALDEYRDGCAPDMPGMSEVQP
jgi:hypothetical protein